MPFRSKSQIAKFAELVKQGKMSQAKFDEWLEETPSARDLPDRAHTNTKIGKAKKAKVR